MEEILKKNEEFLLDLFAKDAMNAIITNNFWKPGRGSPDNVAYHAYSVAEAMILERRKRLPEK